MISHAGKTPLALIAGFARDPGGMGKAMREALELDPAGFAETVLRDEARGVTDRGFRYALILLKKGGFLIPAIGDPGTTSFAQARKIMRTMLEIEKNFANEILDAALEVPELGKPACSMRILDLIADLCADFDSAVARQVTNWRAVTRLHEQHGDGRVRSKCAALLAKFRFQEQGLLGRFERGEPRERADLVEAFWSGGLSKSPALIEQALADPSNRVVGNACLALYHAGNPRALIHLVEMIRSARPEFQNTAAWAMGRLRDARFAPFLREAAQSGSPRLRRTALLALANVERIESCEVTAGLLPIFVSAPVVKGWNELWVRVVRPDGTFVSGLGATDFFTFTDQGAILDYSAAQCNRIGSAFVGIAWPVGDDRCHRAITESLPIRPASQVWALEGYGADSGGPEANCWKLLGQHTAGIDSHLAVILDDSAASIDRVALRVACQARGVRLHCWRIGNDSRIDMGSLWPEFIASLESRYVVRTSPAETVRYLAIREAGETAARFSRVVSIDPGESEGSANG